MSKSKSWIPWVISAVIVSSLLYIGSRNKKDTTWQKVHELWDAEIIDLRDSREEVNQLYQQLHPLNQDADKGWQLLNDPFLPTMRLEKFKSHLQKILDEQFIVFNSNPGVGSTTVTSRIINFVSTDPEHTLEIVCAPYFEVKLHEKYLGNADAALFQFLQKAAAHPAENYFLLIDNLDKINPESLWGPEMWRLFEDKGSSTMIHGIEISIPANFYMISVVHSGAGAIHTMREEHYRRIGNKRYVEVAPEELVLYLRDRKEAYLNNPADGHVNLTDDDKMRDMLYVFTKSNEIIEAQFGKDYQLGQWSSYRNLYDYTSTQQLLQVFVEHINTLQPDINYRLDDLSSIQYAIDSDGKLAKSSWISKKLAWLEEKGYLTEFAVGLSFLLITGLISLFLLKRREKVLSSYIQKLGTLISQYDSNEISLENLTTTLNNVKSEVDQLALSKKINYNEANFFYSFFDDKIRRIEVSKMIHDQFNDLLEVFLEDDHLSQSEHAKLRSFLDRIKNKISDRDYDHYDNIVKSLRSKYSPTWKTHQD